MKFGRSAKAKAQGKAKAKSKAKTKVKRRLSFGDENVGADDLQAKEEHIAQPSQPAQGDKRQPHVRGPTVHKNPEVMQKLAPPGCTIFLNSGLVFNWYVFVC